MEILLHACITLMFILRLANCQRTLPTTEPAEEIEPEDTTTVENPTTIRSTRPIKIRRTTHRKRETTTISSGEIEPEDTTTRIPLTTLKPTMSPSNATNAKNNKVSELQDVASSIFSYIKALRLGTFGATKKQKAQLSLKLNDLTVDNLNSKPTHNDLQHSLSSGPAWKNLINSSEVTFNEKLQENKVTIVPFKNTLAPSVRQRPIFKSGMWSHDLLAERKTVARPRNKQIINVWPEKLNFRFNKKSTRRPLKFRLSNVLSMDNNSKFFSLQKDGNSKLAVFPYRSTNIQPKPPVRNVFNRNSFQFRG